MLLNLSTPSVGGDLGDVTITIVGQGIAQGATVRLRRVGQPDIESFDAAVSPDGSSLQASFDLGGKLLGEWEIIVTNPDGTTATLATKFIIQQGTDAQVWVDVIGRSVARPGRPQSYQIVYGNRGSTDANGVLLSLVMPLNSTYKIVSNIGIASPDDVPDPENLIFEDGVNWGEFPEYVESDEERILPFIVGVVPAGASGVIDVQVTFPSEGNASVEALISEPILTSSATESGAQVTSQTMPFTPDETPPQRVRRLRKQIEEELGKNNIKPDGSIDHKKVDDAVIEARKEWDKAQDQSLPVHPTLSRPVTHS